ncbi:glucose-1-phosphate cytidylyltransferase [Abditibacterium utsteinense]|uniref:Glucose-1-phosphate cytidylyltransferase n=1 Tax=Abditibacterium utsteinense TaxID=1960156 RepID=A0A2S8SS92_9BACT|nr:glucose-1-phosphate cytidylyltransferase [Abditibacterium utsteinense]PQV63684.1 glucose-1-phosphate cytidylyltransferase [Abditibacterium utsteinense]
MRAIILAGGLGTRLQEETTVKPKPMIEIGGRPVLWHIMKNYAHYGISEFVVALGYKSEVIKDYFMNYRSHSHSLSVHLSSGEIELHGGAENEDWMVHLLDTGLSTMTGGRVKRAAAFIGEEPFLLTYGDGVANVDIEKLLAFHKSHGKLATLTAIRPPARFGVISFEGDAVKNFEEKPLSNKGWVNGGFMVLEPEVRDYIEGDATVFERGPLERLAAEGELMAYRHDGFWQCVDTLHDVQLLESLWKSGAVPWKSEMTNQPISTKNEEKR